MVIEEILNDRLVRHYSNNGMMIKQVETGIEYADAVDVIPCRYTYEETETPIETTEEDIRAENADMKSALNVLGVK